TRVPAGLHRVQEYRRLYPVWDDLRQAVPVIVLPASLPWWDLELRIARRLAEINDGRLALQAYIEPDVRVLARRLGQGAGLAGADLEAVVEAASLKVGLLAMAAGRRPIQLDEAALGHVVPDAYGTSELEWLSRVAHAFAKSEIVTLLADRALNCPLG